ncbi:flavin-containing monooxygenase [Arthrobacter sp. 2MCAF15]|uniref:flavin-containing monooxygenase n=1 Tax=Arthrobacter sp. 2MCAF15 TaxID=3232984 RepID=UPI003F8E1968
MTQAQDAGMGMPFGVERYDIVVVGAGFAGINMAVMLKRNGYENFVVLERADAVGGTWRDNHYPGAACDVPSHLYSFSFGPNPNWSRVFSPQNEIWEYQKQVVRDEGIEDKFLFGQDLLSATWDDEAHEWESRTTKGVFRSRFLVTATGNLSDPKYPDIEGIRDFGGVLMHSAAWDDDFDLTNLRVGVVGTGASAIQIVPQVQKGAGHLTVFQRSAPYVTPRHDRKYTAAEKRLFARVPGTIEELRSEMFWYNEGRFIERQAIPELLEETANVALDHLAAQVSDPRLRAQLTPDYQIGCKRILKAQDYYPALTQDNVALETRPIERVEGSEVMLADGTRIELDVLVLATGFEASDPPVAHHITGRSGVVLSDQWQTGMQAFATTAVHNFPNLFILKGPHSGLGHNSIIYIIEAQVDYVLGALTYALQGNVEMIEVSQAAEDEYAKDLDSRAAGTVWVAGGCVNWYVDPRNGRLTTVWPDFAHSFRDENATFDPAPYRILHAALVAV